MLGANSLGGPAAPALPRWPVVSWLVERVVVAGGPTAELHRLGRTAMIYSVIANIGVPMLFTQVSGMAMAIIPVVLIEGMIARRRLSLSTRSAFGGIGLANVVSTLVGIPLAWFAMLLLGELTTGGTAHGLDTPWEIFNTVVLQASWLVPYEQDLHWMIPSAFLVLLVPSFIASALIERFVLLRLWKTSPRPEVTHTVWIVNSVSYSILFAVGSAWLYYEWSMGPWGAA